MLPVWHAASAGAEPASASPMSAVIKATKPSAVLGRRGIETPITGPSWGSEAQKTSLRCAIFGNIAQVRDVSSGAAGHGVGVRIELTFDEQEPPTGSVMPEGSAAMPFTGWLGLLRLLGDLRADGAPGLTAASVLTVGGAGGGELEARP